MKRRSLAGTVLAFALLVPAQSVSAASIHSASPSIATTKDPLAIYCDQVQKTHAVGSFLCVQRPAEISPSMDLGVTDKWHWSRNKIIGAWICSSTACTQVAQIRETESVSLNGRRSDASMTLQTFTGGPIKPKMLVQCQKDNGWFPTSECTHNEVIGNTFLASVWRDNSAFFHSEDDQYWYKYTWSAYIRDHPNPNTSDGIWNLDGYLDSAHFVCDKGYPFTEVCRFS